MKKKIFLIKIALIIFSSIIMVYIPTTSRAGWFDDVCSTGDEFIKKGENGAGNIETLSDTNANIFNILSTVGMFLSIAVGGILGIKFMLASVEDKAKIKESLTPYIVGSIIVFGAFAIWKFIILTLDGI